MQSRTSYFNKTLFFKNLTRFWPLWGGASALGALPPLVLLTELLRTRDFWGGDNPLSATATCYQILSTMVPIISLLYAILCALAVWSYLFSPRSVNMTHALPITRRGLYLTNCLSGLAMMLIPYVITGVLTVLVLVLAGLFEPVGILVTILGVLGESLFYFATATFAAFCTGNIFAMAALYFIFHFLASAVEWMLTVFFSGFYFGVSDSIRGFAGMLSPTAYLLDHVGYDTTTCQGTTASGYVITELESVSLTGGWVIGVYALIGLAILAACWALYARRRSESAGDVVAVGWMKPIFRYGAAFCAAVSGGLGLYALFIQNFHGEEVFAPLPMAVTTAIAGVVGYYIASMLLAKSFKVFKTSWKGAAAVVLFCAVFCGGTSLDPLGVEARRPAAEDVEDVYVSLHGERTCSGYVSDPAAVQEVLNAHGAILAQRDLLKTLQRAEVLTWEEPLSSVYVVFRYTLKDGGEIWRSYSFYYSPENPDRTGDVIPALSRLAVNPDLQRSNMFGNWEHRDNVRLTGGEVQDLYDPETEMFTGVSLDAAQSQTLKEAMERDIQAGRFGKTIFQGDQENLRYYADIYFYYAYDVHYDEGEVVHDTGGLGSLSVSVYCTETLAALEDLGVIDDTHRLLTEEERNLLYDPDYYEEYYQDRPDYYYDKYLNEPGSSSTAVIGGADGPTPVMVN